MTARLATATLCALTLACDGDTPTSPTTPEAPTVAEPSIVEDFVGTLAVGGSSFYSFVVGENGTVNITLASIEGLGVPPTVWMGLGLGVPSGEDCATTTSLSAQAGSTPQVTGTYGPGVYCARVYDIGNLAAAAQFAVTIAHP